MRKTKGPPSHQTTTTAKPPAAKTKTVTNAFAWRLLSVDHALLPSRQTAANDRDKDDTGTDDTHSLRAAGLTDDHVLQLRGVFLRQDDDRDGFLHTDQLLACLRELGFPTRERFLCRFCVDPSQVTVRGGASVSFRTDFATFVRVIAQALPQLRRVYEDLMDLFALVDEHDSGRVTRADLKHLLTGIDAPTRLAPEEFSKFVRALHFDERDSVAVADLLQHLLFFSPLDLPPSTL